LCLPDQSSPQRNRFCHAKGARRGGVWQAPFSNQPLQAKHPLYFKNPLRGWFVVAIIPLALAFSGLEVPYNTGQVV